MLAQELNRRLRLDLTMVPIDVIRRYRLKKILLLTTKVITSGETQLVRRVSWYDNEMSYVAQLVRTVNYFGRLISTKAGAKISGQV